MQNAKRTIKIAILDLYEGLPNEGMRCLRSIIRAFGEEQEIEFLKDEFEVRLSNAVPDLSYDIYISSGGPGSPLDSEGSQWEKVYFEWLDNVFEWNKNSANKPKVVFFICHSFQLICRQLQLATVCNRKSTAFGVFPVHPTGEGLTEPVFKGLEDPFYVVDSRDFQVVEPNQERLQQMGATILAIEKERAHVPLERAIMAIRFNDYMLGTQFHPEADPLGMRKYLQRADKKKAVTESHGFEKWQSMMEHLNDPQMITATYATVLPNFLHWYCATIKP